MAVMAGLKEMGLFQRIGESLLKKFHSERGIAFILIFLCFISSMFITNDVALITFVPLAILVLGMAKMNAAACFTITLMTIAANLGSMLTPIGNPQNLYLYAFYSMNIGEFFSVTLPLTLLSLIVLIIASIPLLPKTMQQQSIARAMISSTRDLLIFLALFGLCLLTVFKVVSYLVTTAIVVLVLLLLNRKLLKEIDYMLLLTFVCFFTVSENLGRIEVVREFLQQLLRWNTLFTAVITSQVISNVPADVVLSGFTDQWQQLLAGVNIGGLGTPIASLASLITIKFYMGRPDSRILGFLGCFTLVNVVALSILLLFAWMI
jgi:Na+/H+ antiporter NhaD/arsenite permease-like protein